MSFLTVIIYLSDGFLKCRNSCRHKV